jgi:ATP-dependent DNA ligase
MTAGQQVTNEVISVMEQTEKIVKPMLARGLDVKICNLKQYEQTYFAQEKLDGTRIVVVKQGDKIQMRTRGWKNDLAASYPEIVDELKKLPMNVVLDGEMMFYEKGTETPVFMTALATPEMKRKYDIRLMLFDILEYQGVDYKVGQQIARSKVLDDLVKEYLGDRVRSIPVVTENFREFFEEVVKNGGEGLILKDKRATYQEGKRGKMWLKVKREETHDCVVLGLHRGAGKFEHLFGALVVGQIINGEMKIVGNVSGMTDAMREELHKKIMAMPKVPVDTKIWNGHAAGAIHMIAPEMVVEVKCMERTDAHQMRYPVFIQIRHDKTWNECVYNPEW